MALSLRDLWILFSSAHLLLSVFDKTSMALGICCLLVAKRSALSGSALSVKIGSSYLDLVFSDVTGRRLSNVKFFYEET